MLLSVRDAQRVTGPAGFEMSDREPRLILSIDIGASHSAVAVFYCKGGKAKRATTSHTELTSLVIDARPVFTHVARWPGQEGAPYEEKVPSVLIYNAEGEVCCVTTRDFTVLDCPDR